MLDPFLSSYILSLSSHRQERVATILANASLAKDQLDLVSQQLSSIVSFVPLVLAAADQDALISAASILVNLRDVFNRLGDLYSLSNQVSLLLDSHRKILGSDIKALEDQLVVLEKMIQNYGFLFSDGGAYNFGYLESFNDERGRDVFNWSIPDRGQQVFDDTQRAAIRIGEGALVLPDDLNIRYPLTAEVLKSNAAAFMTSDTGIANAVSATSSTGWRMAIAAFTPITASIPEAPGQLGAQVLIEFNIGKSSPASEIQITPLSDSPIELVTLTIFTSDADTIGTNQLVSSLTIDKPVSIQFPLQPVTKFQVVLAQPTYTRPNTYTNIAEERYRRLSNVAKQKLTASKLRFPCVSNTQNASNYSTVVSLANPTTTSLQFTRDLKSYQSVMGPYTMWSKTSEFERTILNFFTSNTQYYNRLFRNAVGSAKLINVLGGTNLVPSPQDPPPTNALPSVNQITADPGFTYQYTLGLRYIGIGSAVPSFKGAFVSIPIPSDGDMGEVRLKVNDTNYVLPNTDRNSPFLTSIEYSVSNQSAPQIESDWIPILPVGVIKIEGERLFPNISGRALLRFQTDTNSIMNVYRNGYTVAYTPIFDPSKNFINGVALDVGTYTSDDFLTADYYPSGDQTIVDFTQNGFSSPPLITSHDNLGAGESFVGTTGRNSVDLSYFPYIDPTQVSSSLYQPITVVLENGITAINLTNYASGIQPTFPSTGGYYYIQSDNVLLFNVPVTQRFKVYYQYLQNNVRMRAVLRANSAAFVSPSVHCMHLKAKTRRSSASNLSWN